MDERLYTVGELAGELDVTPRALRFYEDKGLVLPRRIGQNRVYSRRDRARIILILRGKRLGFSLRLIREWLDLYDQDSNQVAQMSLLQRKVEARIAKLEQQRQDIDATIAELRSITEQIARHLAGEAPQGEPAPPAAAA